MKRFVLALVMVVSGSLAAQPQLCSPPYAVEQRFPTTGTEVSRWKLCWQVLQGPNLVITGAWFRPAPDAQWIKVLFDGRLSQLFVPYHDNSARYYDVTLNFFHVALTSAHCPAPGAVLGPNGEVCRVVRDRGVMWMIDDQVRRGEELVLWSVLDAAYYDYILEWRFRDDGVIETRTGAAGYPGGAITHMHGSHWRLDIDLNGACCDTASRMWHQETGYEAKDQMTDLTTAQGLAWNPAAYDIVHVRDAALKVDGKSSEWHLMPSRSGTPIHHEDFTKFTFWVTPYVWGQNQAEELPTYVSGSPSTANTDVVLWYHGGLHHMIRNEDSDAIFVMYEGFTLMPINVWPSTPFFPAPQP